MVAVIGDIHGCINTLVELVSRIRNKYPDISIYSVGDLVDRGNFSFDVMEFIISQNIRFTPGNHDYMFYYFIKEPTSEIGRAWLYNGSERTIESYNNHFDKISSHLELIINAPLYIDLDDCFISHAGVSVYFKNKLPRNPLDNFDVFDSVIKGYVKSEHGILWTRDDLINLGKLQLVGHTRQQQINYYPSNNIAYIDTSVYTGNKLSAVIVEENEIIDSFAVPTVNSDIA